MKNCDLLVSGPELAIATMPRALNCGVKEGRETETDGQQRGAAKRTNGGVIALLRCASDHRTTQRAMHKEIRVQRTLSVDLISSAKGFPQMLCPPFPVPEGSPVWTMKSAMLRWSLQPVYVPAAQWARKFSAARGAASQNNSIWDR